MNFCQKCGNKNDGNTRFCQKCGNMLQPVIMKPTQQPVQQTESNEPIPVQQQVTPPAQMSAQNQMQQPTYQKFNQPMYQQMPQQPNMYQQWQPGVYPQGQYNMQQQPIKKKDSPVAVVAAAFILITIFPLPAFLAFILLFVAIILCLIDLGINDKRYKHIGCAVMLIIAIAMFVYVLSVMGII